MSSKVAIPEVLKVRCFTEFAELHLLECPSIVSPASQTQRSTWGPLNLNTDKDVLKGL